MSLSVNTYVKESLMQLQTNL